MQRRRFLILGAALLPAAALAHEGHGAANVSVEIAEAVVAERRVIVDARLVNFGSDVLEVTGLWAAGAEVSADLPVVLPAGGARSLTADLVFAGEVPGIFALKVVFGAAGSGPVLVMPTGKGDSDV